MVHIGGGFYGKGYGIYLVSLLKNQPLSRESFILDHLVQGEEEEILEPVIIPLYQTSSGGGDHHWGGRGWSEVESYSLVEGEGGGTE